MGVDRSTALLETSVSLTSLMVDLNASLTAIPALGPENGGDGEKKKAEHLKKWLQNNGFDAVKEIQIPDARVGCGYRPALVVEVPGKVTAALWIMSHLDIVPPGEMGLWKTDPYAAVQKNGRLYGRGVEDNHQGLCSSIQSVLTLKKAGLVPYRTIKLLFVPDEETGSEKGIDALLKESPGLFSPRDVFLVPDGGNADSTMMEVAEKSILWLKFTLIGKQCHASRPDHGVNAFLAGSALALLLHDLELEYNQVNPLFTPARSTFSPTKKEANVPNINTIPGEDVFYLDCRILPEISLEDVKKAVEIRMKQIEKKYSVTVRYDICQELSSPATAADCALVGNLFDSIREVYKVMPRPMGIGGGTVAGYLRNAGFAAVVWATLDDTAHMPNEYSVISNMEKDAVVMALLALKEF